MKHLRQIWFIALKDLKLFVTDRMALFFFILFPFLFITMFSFIMSGVGQQDTRLELHMVTQEDRTGLSHQIIKAIVTEDDSELKPGELKIVSGKKYEEAFREVEDKKLDGFIAFPEDFTDGVLMGYGAEIEVVVDPEATNTGAALNGMADAIAHSIGVQQAASNAITGLLVEEWLEPSSDMTNFTQDIQLFLSVQRGIQTKTSLIEFGVEKVGEMEAENPSNYVIPGYLVMFVFFASALSAEAIVRERQNHTLERLLASSVRRESILGGLFAGTAAKGLIQLLIFWTAGILAFRIDLGISPVAVIILSVFMVFMSSSFAIMLATLARTQRSASSMAVITSLVLAPLGGCWWPLFITPQWMQFVAKLTPHGWATTGFNKLMVFGADFSAVVPEMLALAGFTAVFIVIGVTRFRMSAV